MSSGKQSPESQIAVVHYKHLRHYLQNRENQGASTDQRASARNKLTFMKNKQFLELSTDVHDEIKRRQLKENANEYADENAAPRPELAGVPFLPIQKDLHPERNQARQKLAKLTNASFKDLAGAVMEELEWRFSGVKKDEILSSFSSKQTLLEKDSYLSTELASKESSKLGLKMAPSQALASQKSHYEPKERDLLSNAATKSSRDLLSSPQSQERMGKDTYVSDSRSRSTFKDKGELRINRDSQLKVLVRRISEMEKGNGELMKLSDNVKKLEDEITTQTKLTASCIDNNNKLRSMINDMKVDYNGLLGTIKSVSTNLSELQSEVRTLSESINSIRLESNREYTGSKSVSSLDKASIVSTPIRIESRNTLIDESKIQAFVKATNSVMDALNRKSQSELLLLMKSMVFSCRYLIGNSEQIEDKMGDSLVGSPDERDATKNKIISILAYMMTVMKKMSQDFSSTDMDTIKDSIMEITSSLQSLVIQVSLKKDASGLKSGSYTDDMSKSGLASRMNSSSFSKSRDMRDSGDPVSDVTPSQNGNSDGIGELRAFLERQTDSVVRSLHDLLSAIRKSDPISDEFKQTLSSITNIVESLIAVFSKTMLDPGIKDRREECEEILSSFSEANKRFKESGNAVINDPLSKTNRKILASSSYYIAKCVKRLITFID